MKLRPDKFYAAWELRPLLTPDLILPQFTWIESRMGVAWLSENLHQFDFFGFNVRIGDVVKVPEDLLPSLARGLQESSQKRVDIVAVRPENAAIVEVKVRIPIGALGQVLGYATIFQAENPTLRSIEKIVVGGDAMLDIPELLAAYGVQMVLYRELWLRLGSPSE